MSTSLLLWYANRLRRMSPAEVLHRLNERGRLWLDGRRQFDWSSFGDFGGALSGLPGLRLESAGSDRLGIAADEADRIRKGPRTWLGQQWPAVDGCWWREGLWTLDPVSGTHWPGTGVFHAKVSYRHDKVRGDVKFVWEPNRLQMLQPLALLAANGDHEALALGFDILGGWMDANPPFEGINWTSGIESASRVVSVLTLMSAGRGTWSAETDARLRAFLAAHAYMLTRYPSLFSSANNHRISELAALLMLGVCAPSLAIHGHEPAALLRELEREINLQFHSDGVGAEQSPTYAAYSLEWFVLAAIAAEAGGQTLSDSYRARAWAAAEHLMWLMDDAGRTPRIGDDDEGRVLALRLAPELRYPASVASLAASWLGRPGLAKDLHDPELRDLVSARRPEQSATPPVGDRTFTEGGYTVVRQSTPRGTAVLVMDHAPLGYLSIAAHGHADALSLTLSWGEEPVIVDAGTYLYHSGGVWRDRFRGTAAHNTICLEGADQSRIVGSFAWADHARSRLTERTSTAVTARHDGYTRRFGVAHERKLIWSDSGYTIEDGLFGRFPKALAWSSGFTLAPGSQLKVKGGLARVTTPAGRGLVLEAEGSDWTLVEVNISDAFNHLTAAPRLLLSGKATNEGPVARILVELET